MTLVDEHGRAWEAIWATQAAPGTASGLRITAFLARAAGDRRPMARMVPDDAMALQIVKISTQSKNENTEH